MTSDWSLILQIQLEQDGKSWKGISLMLSVCEGSQPVLLGCSRLNVKWLPLACSLVDIASVNLLSVNSL